MLYNIKAAIFDLDGTLVDSLEDLADTTNTALEAKGLPTHPVGSYRYFVGEGIHTMLERSAPANTSSSELEELVSIARTEYSKHWARKTHIYSGILEMLSQLQSRNIPLAVLSNKLDDFTKAVVAHFFPANTFGVVMGSPKNGTAKPDPRAALSIAEKFGVAPEQTLFMGDTKVDMQTANNAGMVAAGVLWGFRPKSELEEHNAKIILEQPTDLFKYI